jgi:uncharacterized protein (TIGR03083 family)
LTELPRAEFAFPGPLRDRLVAAILAGEKTATTALLREYQQEGEALPRPGDRSVLVDSADRPCAVLQTTEVRVLSLAEMDLAHAVDEGEGFTDVAGWRHAHTQFWRSAPMLAALGDVFTIDDQTMVVAERFHVVERVWRCDEVSTAYATEGRAAVAALRSVPPETFRLPTRCQPWTVLDLLAHTVIALARTDEMLDDRGAAGRDGAGLVGAVGYYAPDARFRADVDGTRVSDAQRWAAVRTPVGAVDELARTTEAVAARVLAEGPDALVRTRHGDSMRLVDFQATRVVELAVHGVDLADGLGVAPWLTDPAADLVAALATGTTQAPLRAARAWDRPTLVRAVTGRGGPAGADGVVPLPAGVRSPFFGGTHRPGLIGEE